MTSDPPETRACTVNSRAEKLYDRTHNGREKCLRGWADVMGEGEVCTGCWASKGVVLEVLSLGRCSREAMFRSCDSEGESGCRWVEGRKGESAC